MDSTESGMDTDAREELLEDAATPEDYTLPPLAALRREEHPENA